MVQLTFLLVLAVMAFYLLMLVGVIIFGSVMLFFAFITALLIPSAEPEVTSPTGTGKEEEGGEE